MTIIEMTIENQTQLISIVNAAIVNRQCISHLVSACFLVAQPFQPLFQVVAGDSLARC